MVAIERLCCGPGTVLSISFFTLTFPIPMVQIRTLRLGEVNKLTQSHTGSKNSSSLVPGPTTLTMFSHRLSQQLCRVGQKDVPGLQMAATDRH